MQPWPPSPFEQRDRAARLPLRRLLAAVALVGLSTPVAFATGASAAPTASASPSASAPASASASPSAAPSSTAPTGNEPGHVDLSKRPRLVVMTDIGGDPDDRESMVRLLLYSNEINLEGLIASNTGTTGKPLPEAIDEVIDGYAKVRGNLVLNSDTYPTAETLHSLVAAGTGARNLAGISDTLSAGARKLIQAVDKKDARPVWVSIWGGGNTLAETLKYVRDTRTTAQLNTFVSKLRVYTISDQDDAGPWIRAQFPSLYYIATPGGSQDFYRGTWTGISGETFFDQGDGPDTSLVSPEWVAKNIQSVGALGAEYPTYRIQMEGDTPSYLNLIDNGLNGDVSPNWGGWGGRYIYRTPPGEPRSFWTNGGSSRDTVKGIDGELHTTDQATVWRWRQGYQNDFAARMQWTIHPFAEANHAPKLVVNGSAGTDYLSIAAKPGEAVKLSAANTSDPDGNHVSYEWFAYQEAGAAASTTAVNHNPRPVEISDPTGVETVVTAGGNSGSLHIILKVTDDGTPAMTSYRRVVLKIGATVSITGTPQFGQTLTAVPDAWAAGTTLAYQWLRGGVAIPGATSSTYKTTLADVGQRLTVQVTGTTNGSAPVTVVSGSASVVAAQLKSSTPGVTGKAKVGKTLTGHPGTWTSGTTLSYRWRADGKVIEGKTGKKLKLTSKLQGKKISFDVTGTKTGYATVVQTSDETKAVAKR